MTAPVLNPNTRKQANSVCNIATGQVTTDDGTAVDQTFQLGFKPRYICFINLTDRIRYEWFEGLANPGSIKTLANGTVSIVAIEADGITVNAPSTSGQGTAVGMVSDPGLLVGGEHTNSQGGVAGNSFTVDEDIIVASKVFSWMALG